MLSEKNYLMNMPGILFIHLLEPVKKKKKKMKTHELLSCVPQKQCANDTFCRCVWGHEVGRGDP